MDINSSNLDATGRSKAFYETVQKMAPMSLGKLEKILSHIKANDQVVAGKISLADFTILQAYIMMCDAKMNSLEAFKTACPTGRVLVLLIPRIQNKYLCL